MRVSNGDIMRWQKGLSHEFCTYLNGQVGEMCKIYAITDYDEIRSILGQEFKQPESIRMARLSDAGVRNNAIVGDLRDKEDLVCFYMHGLKWVSPNREDRKIVFFYRRIKHDSGIVRRICERKKLFFDKKSEDEIIGSFAESLDVLL